MFVRFMIIMSVLLSTPSIAKRGGKSYAMGHVTYTPGGMGFGASYESQLDKWAGWGAYFMSFATSETGNGGSALGGFIRPHMRMGRYDLSVTAGFGTFSIETLDGVDNASAIGPIFGMACLRRITRQIAVGLEVNSYYGWLSEPMGELGSASMLTFQYRL